ncbi:MAG TPA: efflux RND transporter periplasmic adaptor subunit, partial [Aminivibrio sp.]|nr:efflux RND transporter periplasmic adaptor subunit [Aminivibrio sp.]
KQSLLKQQSAKAGQVLLTLSSQDYRASAAADRVSYEDAVRDYKRLSELHKSGGVSKAQVEQAFSRMKSEEAKLQSSRSTLARTQIRASIDGIVASRSVEPGEVASDGKALLTIIDLKDLEAEIMVSRKDILSLNKDTPVEVLSDGQKTKCSIKRISPEAAPGSGLYPVVVCLNGLDVLPGTHVEARFLVDKKKDLIIIPSEIVQRRGDKAYVYVVDSERAKLREIVPGEGQNGSVSIENGLSEGDLVVVRGHNLLFENALVALTGEAAAGTAGK